MVKFLVIGDLHGRKPRIHFKDFDAIIVPGDVCDDRKIKPYTDLWKKSGNTKQDDEAFIKEVIGKRKWDRLNKESLKVGREILQYLNSFKKPVFIVPGNWDQSYGDSKVKNMSKTNYNYAAYALYIMLGEETNRFLKKGLKNIHDCQFKLFKTKEFNIIGYGLSNFPEKEMAKKRSKNSKERKKLLKLYSKVFNKLEKEFKKRDKNKPTIFLTHNIPYNTKLDQVINKGTYAHKKHYGSNIARDFCKKYKPLICIGGHMHEHFGKIKLEKTIVVNAGYGPNVNTFLEIEGNKIKKLKFHKGK